MSPVRPQTNLYEALTDELADVALRWEMMSDEGKAAFQERFEAAFLQRTRALSREDLPEVKDIIDRADREFMKADDFVFHTLGRVDERTAVAVRLGWQQIQKKRARPYSDFWAYVGATSLFCLLFAVASYRVGSSSPLPGYFLSASAALGAIWLLRRRFGPPFTHEDTARKLPDVVRFLLMLFYGVVMALILCLVIVVAG